MAFARTAAVAGAGTVSCAGTTTVTGSGTAFAFAIGAVPATTAARVGGTITVGGVTKTITAIASATSLTVDSAFGTFTAQAFTVQTGITQTGTDTLTNATAAPTGLTLREDRGSLMRLFDVGGQDLFVEGTLTVASWGAQLRNDGSCANRFEVIGSASGGEFIVNGRKATANNGPFPYPGFDWLGNNGNKVMRLRSTNASFPGKFTVIDGCVRFGADWITTDSGNFSRITTQGEECWILCARGTGTGQARIRQDNTTATIDFQATQTWIGVWLNFGVPQVALKGYTPIDTDGPEINLASVPTATRITLEDYNTTYVVPNYYAGAQIVLLGGAWTRIKNNLRGTNIVWMSSSASGRNVLEYSKQITIRAQDAAGNLLSDGFMYYQPVGSNVAGIRAKGGTVDITFDLTQQVIATVSGAATSEFVYAWGYTNANGNQSVYNYFCTGTTKGSETHVIRSTRYGYDKQGATVTLAGNGAATPTFVHASLPTTDKIIANAAAITGLTFNFTTKTWTNALGSTRTVQEIYDAYQYQLNQTANLQQPNECVVTNGQFFWTGWTAINNGTITAGAAGHEFGAATVTNNGTISAIYAAGANRSTTFELRDIKAGAAYVVANNATKATILFGTNATGTPQTYVAQFPPGSAGTEIYVARKTIGDFFDFEVVTLAAGLVWTTFTDIPDEGAKETNPTVLNAYTALETNTKLYNYVTGIYMRTEEGIKLGEFFSREGTFLNWSAPYSVKVNQSAASLFSKSGNLSTIKATGLAGDANYDTNVVVGGGTLTANTNEVLTTEIVDANGDSSLTIQGGSGSYEVWKVANGTPEDNYATGTLLADNVGLGKWRFTGTTGFYILVRDKAKNNRDTCSMEKGTYVIGLYAGRYQITVAQLPEVYEIQDTLALMQIDVDNIPTSVWTHTTRTLTEGGGGGGGGSGGGLTTEQAAQLANIEALAEASMVEHDATHAAISELPTATEIAAQVETAILTDGDGKAVLQAIADKIGNENVTAAVIASTVRSELSTELARLDANVSSRSTLAVGDIPAGLTAAQVWAAPTRTLTAASGITAADVWAHGTRTLTDGTAVAEDVWASPTRELTAAVGLSTEQAADLDEVVTNTRATLVEVGRITS